MDAGPGNQNFQMSPSIKTEEISIHEDCLHLWTLQSWGRGFKRRGEQFRVSSEEEKSRLVLHKGVSSARLEYKPVASRLLNTCLQGAALETMMPRCWATVPPDMWSRQTLLSGGDVPQFGVARPQKGF